MGTHVKIPTDSPVLDLTLKRLPKGETETHYRYEVRLNGELLVVHRDPEFAACRALVARGYSGKARFWREGKEHPDIEIRDIVKAARYKTLETPSVGPKFAKYVEMPEGQVTPTSVPYGRRMPRRILTPSPARLTPQAISPPGLG